MRTHAIAQLVTLASAVALLGTGCSGGNETSAPLTTLPPNSNIQLAGSVQKGPFVQG